MERIEIPATSYFQARDGKKFSSQAECERYEYLLDKYMNAQRHTVCEDGEGRQQHFFFSFDHTDAEELSEWCRWLHGYICKVPENLNPNQTWIWLQYDFDGYGPCPVMQTVTDFIVLQEECARGYNQAVKEARQILKVPVLRC